MIAFGGNGPLHATRVARSAGVSRIVIPPNPGVGSAVGFLYAPVSFEIVRSRYSMLDGLDIAGLNAFFAQMIDEARTVVAQGAGDAQTQTRRSAFMRYNGQGHEIEISLPDRDLAEGDIQSLTQVFEAEYARQFSRPVPGMKIEILNWAVRVATQESAEPQVPEMPDLTTLTPEITKPIICDVDATVKQAAVVARDSLTAGDHIHGPALITEPQTTTLVSADFSARVDALGNLVLVRDQKGGAQ